MRNKISLILLIGLIPFAASAQTDSTVSRVGWFVSLHSGVLFPQVGNALTISTHLIQGIRYDRVSFGVGVGYDSYEYWETLPVFTGVAYDVLRRGSNALYVGVNGGYSNAWNRLPDELSVGMEDDGGYFIHPLVGYRLHQGRVTLHLTGGYKIQRIHYRRSINGWGLPMVTSVVQDMERISIQMGIGLR